MKYYLRFCIFVISVCIANRLFGSDTIYINSAATGFPVTGFNWTYAYRSLQDALISANYGDKLWVAEGLYNPSNDTSSIRDSKFSIPKGVSLYGGFGGWEENLGQRNIITNQTILSGDIGIINDSTDNCYTVVYFDNPDSLNRIDGFYIEAGNSDFKDDPLEPIYSHRRNGGGIYVIADVASTIQIQNCIFLNNYSDYTGGAIFFQSSSKITPYVSDCIFLHNRSNTRGGAIYSAHGLTCQTNFLFNCKFLSNTSGYGGAMAIDDCISDTLQIESCYFKENSGTFGSAISYTNPISSTTLLSFTSDSFINNFNTGSGSSGAVHVFCTSIPIDSVYFDRCAFIHQIGLDKSQSSLALSITSFLHPTSILINHGYFSFDRIFALVGSGLNKLGLFQFENSIFNNCASDSPIMHLQVGQCNFFNSLVYRNQGSILCSKYCIFTNSLSAYNKSNSKFGILRSTYLAINNTIFWQNKTSKLLADSILLRNNISNSFFDSLYNLEGDMLVSPVYVKLENNQEGTDPLMIDPEDDNYNIISCSPAINAGINFVLVNWDLLTDFAGNKRVVDDTVDIGPYEHPNPFTFDLVEVHDIVCHGDANGEVDFMTNGVEPLILSWSMDTLSGVNTTNLQPGNYYFTLEDGDLCMSGLPISITEPPQLIVNEETKDIECHGDSTGVINIFTFGGTPPYSVNWSNGSSGLTLSSLVAGDYEVTVTDSNGCNKILQIPLSESSEIEVQLTINRPNSEITRDGTILISDIRGGIAPYGIVWDNGSNSLIRDSLPAGTYTLYITDSLGCVKTKDIELIPVQIIGSNISSLIWPNPINRNHKLHIRLTSGKSFILNLVVYDALGREIPLPNRSFQIYSGTHTIELPFDLPYGIYFIELKKENIQIALSKLIVTSD